MIKTTIGRDADFPLPRGRSPRSALITASRCQSAPDHPGPGMHIQDSVFAGKAAGEASPIRDPETLQPTAPARVASAYCSGVIPWQRLKWRVSALWS